MAKKISLKAAIRDITGSGKLKALRRQGLVPAVIYGHGEGNRNINVNAKEFASILSHSTSENILIDLEVTGCKSALVFLQNVQHDHLSGEALHADFLAIDEKTPITAHIPVNLHGDAAGVKAGGILEQYIHSLEIVCLPDDLPESIDIDVTNLGEGASLHIGDVQYGKGIKPTHAADVVIVHIGKLAAAISEEAAAKA